MQMANKHMKRWTTPLIVRGMYVSITMKSGSHLVGWPLSKKQEKTSPSKDVDVGGHIKWYSQEGKQYSFLRKLKIELLRDPEIFLLGPLPKELKTDSWRNIPTPTVIKALFTILRGGRHQRSISRGMNKQHVVCMDNGTLCSLQKEGEPVTCFSTDEPWGYY